MSRESEAIAQTLSQIADARLSPSLIDMAHQLGCIPEGKVLATSLGSVSRAVITPYYPEIQFANSIFDRLDAAATQGHPFAEASITVAGQDLRQPTSARVVLRFCEEPWTTGESVVSETACAYNLSDTSEYGETDRVVDEIHRRRSWGEFLPHQTGNIIVPPAHERGSHGKWRIRSALDPKGLSRAIRRGIGTMNFAKPLDLAE